MNDLYLIYIHEFGKNYKERYYYEFLFSNTKVGIDGEDWDSYPASSGNPAPPSPDFIKQVGNISGDFHLKLVQNNEQFSMWDAIDGVVALGWEEIDGDDYPEPRLTFQFGMTLKEVESRLYERDIIIKFEKAKV